LAREILLRLQSLINPASLPDEIQIKGTNDNASVCGTFSMKADEVLAIERQNSTSKARCKCQNFLITDSLFGFASFQDGEHVMSEAPQFFDNGPWEVFIRVHQGHKSRFLIISNLLLDLRSMGAYVSPSVNNVLRAQRRIDS
jgi:hypothetical protein